MRREEKRREERRGEEKRGEERRREETCILFGFPRVMPVSAVEKSGLSATWKAMNELLSWRKEEGHFENNRAMQARFWFEEDVKQGLLALLNHNDMRKMMSAFAIDVEEGRLLPSQAARKVISRIQDWK